MVLLEADKSIIYLMYFMCSNLAVDNVFSHDWVAYWVPRGHP